MERNATVVVCSHAHHHQHHLTTIVITITSSRSLSHPHVTDELAHHPDVTEH